MAQEGEEDVDRHGGRDEEQRRGEGGKDGETDKVTKAIRVKNRKRQRRGTEAG